jgi:hypothetical protein
MDDLQTSSNWKQKIKKISLIFLIVYLGLSFIITVSLAGYMTYQTGNARPIIKETVEKLISSDYEIFQSVETLKDASLPYEYTKQLKVGIIQTLIRMAVVILGFYALLYGVISKLNSPNPISTKTKIFFIFASIIIVLISQMMYNGFAHGLWDFPMMGIKNLVMNGYTISNWGTEIAVVAQNMTVD